MKNQNTCTIEGITFEAVKKTFPLPYYVPKVVATGYVFEDGIFQNDTRPHMWESIRVCAKRLGVERFKKEMLTL